LSAVYQTAALACTVLGVVSAAAVLLRTHNAPLTLSVLLDFLLAAALLRLSAGPTTATLTTVAVLVLLRAVITTRLARTGTSS
jgi:uncharacterized membrane protein